MSTISTSLIVSTYNWPNALHLCLMSIKNQTLLPDEVIVADDGSTEETKFLIEDIRKSFSIPLIHIWQPDEGFQLSKIRNKAIVRASKDYVIQIDGDLILHKKFIADHVNFARPGSYATGSRVMINEEISRNLLQQRQIDISIFSRGLSNVSNGFRISILKNYLASRYRINDMYYMRGCNMAFWRDDLLKVNGYNEEFVGWGREDNEIAVRLINLGVSKRVLKFGAVVFHLHHKVSTREGLDKNDQILLSAIENGTVYISKGLDQYL